MDSTILDEIKQTSLLSPSQHPYFQFLPPPPPAGFNLNDKVSPRLLLIIIILAVIFFISGVLHLFVRILLRPPNRDSDEIDNVTALQGQLQQLFHLHDAGVDQSFIDALPVFNYKSIIGVKDPFDCAVCLCEFESEDKLRLLPKCSHAFHLECIDTWLLSHSTCPLCRASLMADFPAHATCSPIVLLLESESRSSREIVPDDNSNNNSCGNNDSDARVSSHSSGEFKVFFADPSRKSGEIQVKEEENRNEVERIVSVKLGKFKNVDGDGEEGGSNTSIDTNADARRCFSMGSFAYVMDENSSLQVPIRTPMIKTQSSKKSYLPSATGYRSTVSECGCDSRREFNGFEAFRVLDTRSGEINSDQDGEKKSIGRSKESFRVSKIWSRVKKDDHSGEDELKCARRAASFRFPTGRYQNADGSNAKSGRRAKSEIDMSSWDNEDEEMRSCNGLDSHANPPSFARRTLLWIMGRPNKVVHSSCSSNV